MTVPPLTGPMPKTSVTLVPGALTAAASLVLVARSWASRRRRSSRKRRGELEARCGDSAGRGDLLPDLGSLSCGDLLPDTAGNQVAEHGMQPGRRPGYGTGPDPGAAWPTPSARRRDPRPSPGGRPWTAAPQRPPAGHRSGRSYWYPRPPAAAPGRPASAAHPARFRRPPPAAGPADAPAPAAPSTAQARSGHACAHATSCAACDGHALTRILPSGCSPAPIATAVCELLCGVGPDHHCRHETSPAHREK